MIKNAVYKLNCEVLYGANVSVKNREFVILSNNPPSLNFGDHHEFNSQKKNMNCITRNAKRVHTQSRFQKD